MFLIVIGIIIFVLGFAVAASKTEISRLTNIGTDFINTIVR
jgi:hypothetical protein